MKTQKTFLWPVFWDFFIPILLLTIITIFFRATNWDLKIAGYFFDSNLDLGFRVKAYPWYILYEYGVYPAYISVAAACLIFLIGFLNKAFKSYRLRCLFVMLLFTISPYIIVNLIFKDHWGRPRPVQCAEFKGKNQFVKIWTPNFSNVSCKSFPSGHASVAFFMFFPFFIYRAFRKNKKAVIWLLVGLVYGGLMSYGRMYQGGHFASDCLWSGGFNYLTALILYYALGLRRGALNSVRE